MKDSKLILSESQLFPWSSRISLVPFRTFSGPLFCKPVTSQELFWAISYRKLALTRMPQWCISKNLVQKIVVLEFNMKNNMFINFWIFFSVSVTSNKILLLHTISKLNSWFLIIVALMLVANCMITNLAAFFLFFLHTATTSLLNLGHYINDTNLLNAMHFSNAIHAGILTFCEYLERKIILVLRIHKNL